MIATMKSSSMEPTASCQHSTLEPPTLTVDTQQLTVAARMCHAMSDPARLRLLLRLVEKERCVSELVAHEAAKLSSVSARLQTLYAAGLVSRRREAKHIYYALADEHVHILLRNVLSHAAEATP